MHVCAVIGPSSDPPKMIWSVCSASVAAELVTVQVILVYRMPLAVD